jgi:Uncharacterized protein conserved in bacteria
MFGLWRRYGPFVIGAIVAIVAATAGLQWLDSREEAAARRAGGRLLQASAAADPSERAARLLGEAELLDQGPARAARLAAAGALAEAGDAQGAIDLYPALAEEADDAFSAFALYRAGAIDGVVGDPRSAPARLTPLADGHGPFRLLALEARGAARAKAGEIADALSHFGTVLADPAAAD